MPKGEDRTWLGTDQAPGARETALMLLCREKKSLKSGRRNGREGAGIMAVYGSAA
jgi:hypothetical protein